MNRHNIIDAHAHIFPEKVANKATASIGKFYNLPMEHGGTSKELIDSGNKIGVKKYLIFSTATTVEQVQSINNFIYEECSKHSEFIGFGTLHPNMPDYESEIQRIKAFGFKGVKLHPDFQRFYIDAEEMKPIYKALEKNHLMVLCHVGDTNNDFSRPYRLASVAKAFPKLTFIAPHFGGWQNWKEAAECLNLPNVYFDTSSSLYALDKKQILELFHKLSYTKFFFGTDFPMWDHQEELRRFLRLELDESIAEDILYNNFVSLFNQI